MSGKASQELFFAKIFKLFIRSVIIYKEKNMKKIKKQTKSQELLAGVAATLGPAQNLRAGGPMQPANTRRNRTRADKQRKALAEQFDL